MSTIEPDFRESNPDTRVDAEQLADGSFRADYLGTIISTPTADELIETIKVKAASHGKVAIQVVFRVESRADAASEDDDAGFERDLDYTLSKNTELYRRLAQ